MKPLTCYTSNIALRAACWGATAALALFAATVTQAQTFTPTFTNVWVVPAGTFAGMPANNGNNCRGLGISPVTTNVLYFSSVGGVNNGAGHVGVLDFANGSNYLANLNGLGISGGTVLTEGVRVADDGAVYGCNLSGASNSTFRIYRWPSETDTVTAPTIAYISTNQFFTPPSTNSFQWRIGDYMDLRGSGANTEIVVVGAGAAGPITTNFVVFRPTDAACTNFTNFSITIPGAAVGVFTNYCGAGVTFEGTNNAIWIRRAGSPETRRVAYDPATLTATVTRTNTVDQTTCQGLKYYQENGVEMLATVQAASALNAVQIARVFRIPTALTGPFVSVLSSNIPVVTGSQNANALGNVDVKNGYFIFGTPSHGISFFKMNLISNSPPSVTLASANPTVVQGYTNTFTATASGNTPLSYFWYFGSNGVTNQIPGVPTNTYTIGPAHPTNSGGYFVIVTNLYGSATSAVSTFTVLPAKFTPYSSNLWSLAPGSRPYLTTTDTQRGIAYDSVSNRVIVVSRSPTNSVHVLDASTGADLGYELEMALLLSPNPTPAGAFVFNMCGVADDGAVYVGNLITSGGADLFNIYRWDNSGSTATIWQAYNANPAVTRIGDTMAVRGASNNTEILCSFRTGTNVALFLPNDGLGVNYGVNVLTVTNLPADAQANGFAGLGLAFGPGNTFWAKSSAFNLRLVSYNTNDMTATVVQTYTNLPSSEGPLGADNINGYVATIGINQTPHNLSLWDVARGEPDAFQLDRELFATSNVNGNGTGAVAVDTANRRIFALDSNNGLIALSYSLYYLNIGPTPDGGIVTWPGTGNLQSAPVVTGPYTDVIGATTPYTNTTATQIYFRVRR